MSIKNCISVIKGANKSGSITDEAAMEMLEEILMLEVMLITVILKKTNHVEVIKKDNSVKAFKNSKDVKMSKNVKAFKRISNSKDEEV